MDKLFKDLCKDILEASIFWTGADEEKNPKLKRIRTLAALYLDQDFQKVLHTQWWARWKKKS